MDEFGGGHNGFQSEKSFGENEIAKYNQPLATLLPRKLTYSSEKCWFEDYFPFEMVPFQVKIR